MSDPWEEIQAVQTKRTQFRERAEQRRKQREGIYNLELSSALGDAIKSKKKEDERLPVATVLTSANLPQTPKDEHVDRDELKKDPQVECTLLKHLCDVTLSLPTFSNTLTEEMNLAMNKDVAEHVVVSFLQKFSTQQLIVVKEGANQTLEIVNADHAKLLAVVNEMTEKRNRKRKPAPEFSDDGPASKVFESSPVKESGETSIAASMDHDIHKTISKTEDKIHSIDASDILSLISKPTIREKETKKVGEEIMDLLSKPTAKERSLAERFRSQGGATVMEFCPHGTKLECTKNAKDTCKKLHFKKIIQAHTDESLGDCSFLNTCFHMDTCKYVHYEVDGPKTGTGTGAGIIKELAAISQRSDGTILYPAQWIQCDLRFLDMSVLGKFAVVMADPPWDIHMELPYGTMSDDEMRQLGVPQLQDDGLIFLWVTGRAMELGRECLKLWGYDRVDELIWVKTNQLQRIIRTGRTGHWLNHGKEHCLVGLKGDPVNLNRGLDCDVIVAEVRATSHKPDEIYGIIERLSPGTRKIELFGRPHNVQRNWITLGNQVDGVRLVDPQLIEAFRKAYPDGNCMLPPAKT